jgi:hypothetical protein
MFQTLGVRGDGQHRDWIGVGEMIVEKWGGKIWVESKVSKAAPSSSDPKNRRKDERK